LLGAWGAVIPFVGPYFHYAYTPNTTWTWTAARFYLQVLPGAVTFFAGLELLVAAHRVIASAAGWLAAAAGAWFVVGPLLAPLWRSDYIGTPVGNSTNVSVEQIGMFYGLGAAITLLAGVAVGRFSILCARDVSYAQPRTAAAPLPAAESTASGVDEAAISPEDGSAQPRHGWARRGHRPIAH
ncbi:MAG TPA: hypothetical protein VHU91_08540, partial [Mycobacteriales bacterium]|nr:hypothetical protein [Mycobacteriales bacterium]